MTSARTVALIARRELVERARTRSFALITLLLVLLGVVLALALPRLVDTGTERFELGLVGGGKALVTELDARASAVDAVVAVRPFQGEAAARTALEDEAVDAVLVAGSGGATLLVRESPAPPVLVALADQAVARTAIEAALAERGVAPGEASRILSPAPLRIESLTPGSEDDEESKTLGFLGAVALFLALLVYGSVVATGVAEEKTNHASAILLAIVRPSQLLAGKVAGIGLLGLGQLVIVALPVLVATVAAGSLELPAATPRAVGGMLLWFVLGYVLYSTAYAALGALVARSEEVGSATLPLTVVLTAGYFLALEAVQEPASTLARVSSLLPPFAPLVMPVRMGAGAAAAWEVALSAMLTLATALVLIRLGAAVYSRGLAATGPRLRLREALRRPA
ncbi:MAG: ABC transporter permease [Thermoleophilia bacterium]|nr:ABC transporter permease [Thermoleophilia bacterium]